MSQFIDCRYFPIGVTGLANVHKAHVIHSICREKGKKAFVLASNDLEAKKLSDDLTTMGERSFIFPMRDFTFLDIEGQSYEYVHNRLTVLSKVVSGDFDVVIFCIDAGMQRTIPCKCLKENTVTIQSGQEVLLDDIVREMLVLGYERSDKVEGPGQFGLRGGIFDFFSPNLEYPVRIEFWGDVVDTISFFDIETQRRTEPIDNVEIIPATEVIIKDTTKLASEIDAFAHGLKGKSTDKAREILLSEADKLKSGVNHIGSKDKFIPLIYNDKSTLFDYIAEDALLFVSEPGKVKESMRTFLWRCTSDLESSFESGVLCKGLGEHFVDDVYVRGKLQSYRVVCLDLFVHQTYPVPIREIINFTAIQLSTWSGSLSLLCEEINVAKLSQAYCVVLAGTNRAAKTLVGDLKKASIPAEYCDDVNALTPGKVVVVPGTLSAGLEYPQINVKVITYEKVLARHKKSPYKTKNTKSIYSLSEVTPGDCVVHVTHGIGIFRGIKKINMNGVVKDYITLNYAKNDTLYVPVTQLDLISKYVGARDNTSIKLNSLGSQEWKKTKTRVKSNVKDIAKQLLKLYTERMNAKGHAFPPDNEWQIDFERHFEYEETDDQLKCIADIKRDMERQVPMDRLLCGDVGFGKTEVALRAAFKSVCDSKQCAMLVPTTILAWQHYQTISKRFEGFPVRIELLSRFKTPKQQKDVLYRLRRGEIDMVVGTHRLVQDDVKFYNLGLAIIDEEQRFGVKQKEHFKEMFKNVDVLTLSATPIPRTLNMAMSGVRDMSTLEQAPQDRHPIQTYVLEYDSAIINEAIIKEIRRNGQVYYLHNRVETIQSVAKKIQAEIPEAKVGVGHGKMAENELSEMWGKVISQEINVFICTTIIETGVDIPNVNTLIVEDADKMGLSQLHQIRGRVGRSSRRAYAYFTFKKRKILSDVSQKRLSAIREFTEFGSGFKIAMRDLELRGAGNILGGQQHGYMEEVGYEMYVQMLNNAVHKEKGENVTDMEKECLVDIQMSAYIPESYISSTGQRIDMYRRISSIRTEEDTLDVQDELIDRFGEIPTSVKGLVEIAFIRSLAMSRNVYEIKQRGSVLMLYQENIDLKFVSELIKKLPSKVLVNASSKPYISIECGKDALGMLKMALQM